MLGALSASAVVRVIAAPLDMQPTAANQTPQELAHAGTEPKNEHTDYIFEAFPNSNVPTEPVFLMMVAIFGSMLFLLFTFATRIFSYYVFGRSTVSERELAISNLRVVGIRDETLAEEKAAAASQNVGVVPSQSPDSGENEKSKLDIEAQPSSGSKKTKDANVISGPIVPVLRDEPEDDDEEGTEEEEDEEAEEGAMGETEVPVVQLEDIQHASADIPKGDAPAYDSIVAAAPPISDSLNYLSTYSSGPIETMPNSTSYRTLQEGRNDAAPKTEGA